MAKDKSEKKTKEIPEQVLEDVEMADATDKVLIHPTSALIVDCRPGSCSHPGKRRTK
jgi:hypothetical protein